MKHHYTHDVFISHVFEDKTTLADALNERLQAAGFKTWYSGEHLSVGDQIDSTVPKIIAACKYAIIIISPDYFKSKWAFKELSLLIAAEGSKGLVKILPIWHQINKDKIVQEWPQLADRMALYSEKGIDYLLPHLVAELKKRKPRQKNQDNPEQQEPENNPASGHSMNHSGMSLHGTNIRIEASRLAGRDLHIKPRKHNKHGK